MKSYFRENFGSDLLSSLVVFLVALPLCMGIALASGVDPMVGLLSGIIGGIVVGLFAGCPLQVSGPAAGLAVMVFQFIEKYGVSSLVPLGIIVGLVQIGMYRFKLAQYFRAISPALIKGMLAGIGLLILVSQIHIALLSKPGGNGLTNMTKLPSIFFANLIESSLALQSVSVTLGTVIAIFLWQKFLPKINKKFPAPLFAIIVASVVSIVMGLNIDFVSIPKDLISEINFISMASFENFGLGMLFSAIAIAFVASAESLLCVNAVDKMSKTKSDYNQEIFAQGLGNVVAGIVGALPLTGVIVRSSANIESGGKTRGAAFMHGVWLFLLVFLFPKVLELVPIAALAGILIYTGLKLLDLKSIPAIFAKDKKDGLVFILTLSIITAVDLLTGVVIGFVISLITLLIDLIRMDVKKEEAPNKLHLKLSGKATFLHIPKLSKQLDAIDTNEHKEVILDFSEAIYVDDVIRDEVTDWADKAKSMSVSTKLYFPKKLKLGA